MALRVKEIRVTKINSTYEDAYKALPKYAEDILSTNLNSTAVRGRVREKGKAGENLVRQGWPLWNDGNEEIQYATSVELRRL